TVNNGYTYENDELVSVSKPIRINIKDTAPNDAEIAINLTLTAKNDMDKTDHTVYTYNAIYTFRVQKGHALSGVINEDMTLTADEYWIIENSVLIPEGVTVTVEPGTQIQFWPENDLAPYGTTARAYINVEGKMECRGTEEKPINIFPGKGHENDGVLMFGNIDFYYTYLMNPYDIFNSQGLYNYGFSASLLDHCVIIQNSIESFQVIDDSTFKFLGHIGASEINKCIFRYLTPEAQVIDLPTFVSGSMNCSLMEKCSESFCVNTLRNNVFLFNYPVAGTFGTDNLVMMFDNFAFKNNAVLNNLNDYSGDSWMSISGYPGGPDIDISENYWGTTNENLIKRQVFDKDYEVSYSDLIQEPWLTLESESLSEIYPFVTRAYLTDKDGNEITTVSGSQEVTFHVLFNRDMASDIQPSVGFGGSEPFTDYTVMGDWVSDREWQGTMVIDPFINQGRMYMRVQGAAAADDKWLVTGDDHERFFFEVTKSDAQSMALQGAGLPGKTMLSWYQDDFETLAGYNIYRSKSYDKEKNAVEQSFVKLNTSVIANGEETYTDENVEEGKDYYYYFTVMDTDFNESAPSNVVKCTPLDGTLPVIVHEPITKLEKGKSFGVRADVTDNVGVDKVTVWYKNANEEQWQSETMDKISGNSYFVRISANEMSEGTMQYYIAASDGLNTAYFGTENEPLEFVVGDIENTTETTTETTTEATSETSTETTSEVSTETESQKQDDNFLFGDANADGKLLAEDAAFILQKVLNNSFVLEIEKRTSNFKHYIDVDADGAINASDAVEVLQKVLNNSYRMTIERRKENEHQ
ncbi:MAG: hypothetical protein IJR45_00785, partial [Firmicutes bacterium]|nr:hypothetical protein [Bacillota bacterium]